MKQEDPRGILYRKALCYGVENFTPCSPNAIIVETLFLRGHE
jgi:hypothetical protein